MMNDIKLVVGDWSCDGHGRFVDIYIKSNLDQTQINEAYRKGVEKVGFDFVNSIRSTDTDIDLYNLNKLIELGLDLNEENFDMYELEHPNENKVSLDVDSYVLICLFFVKMGDPNFKYELYPEVSEIHLGGYGFFMN